jgi:A/G-specific adenine glycosylase
VARQPRSPTLKLERPRASTLVWAQRQLLKWGRRHHRNFPWRSDRSLYHALVTEVLLQQTGADRVGSIRASLLRAYPNPTGLANALPGDVAKIIRTLGLFRQRSERLVALGAALCRTSFRARSASELAQLPGIGPYAASAVACFVWNRAEPALDVNSARIVARLFGIPIASGEARRHRGVRTYAQQLVSGSYAAAINYGLLDLGATVCRPKPKCQECPLSARCAFYGS